MIVIENDRSSMRSRYANSDIAYEIQLTSPQCFDAVVVASGHYNAPNIPDIPGLADWKRQFPNTISHSKRYRTNEGFEEQNVLLIGAGVSSTDIARDLGATAQTIYQSSRSGPYDLPSHLLPNNAARVEGIRWFDSLDSEVLNDDGSIPGSITLTSGRKLCGIHRIVVCTGYHVSFHFLRQYHDDLMRPEQADGSVLVTNGQQTHNLHRDIFYIPDPTLAFIGVPYHVATFTLFEFQAMAMASVFAGQTKLPPTMAMRKEYEERLERKGAGRTFHSLRGYNEEVDYVDDLVSMVNRGQNKVTSPMQGHSKEWLMAYHRRRQRQKALFSTIRDSRIEKRVLAQIQGC